MIFNCLDKFHESVQDMTPGTSQECRNGKFLLIIFRNILINKTTMMYNIY